MSLLKSNIGNLIVGLASLRQPGLLGQIQNQQRQTGLDTRQAEEDKRRRTMEDFKFKQMQGQAQSRKDVSGSLLGQLPPTRGNLLASDLYAAGNDKAAMSLLGAGQDYGQGKAAINPATGQEDYFVTDQTGQMKWLGTGGKEDRQQQPYSIPVETTEGLRVFDTRTKEFSEPNLGKLVKPKNDPELQSKIASAKTEGKKIGELKGTVQNKYRAREYVRKAIDMVDSGIYTGFWGSLQENVSRAVPGMDKEKAARTQEFMAYIGNTVIPRLQEFGGNDSNEELRYLQRVMGGEITLEEEAIRNILISTDNSLDHEIKSLFDTGEPKLKDFSDEKSKSTRRGRNKTKSNIDLLLEKYK